MTYATRNIASAGAYKKTMMKRLVIWHAVALAVLTALPAFAQDTPPTPPPVPPVNAADVKRPTKTRATATTMPPAPPAPPAAPPLPSLPADPNESPREAARRIRREAREQLRDAERQIRDAERRAEEAERAIDEAEEDADDADENADEDEGPNLRIGDGDDRDIVMTGQDVRVEPGQHVRSAVAVGGSVILAPGAYVEDDAVAVGGDVVLEPGAHVDGDAVSIGGSIKTEPGATIGGSRVNIAPSAHFIGNVFKKEAGAAAWSFFSAIISIIRILVLFALATLLVVLAPDRISMMRTFIADRPFVSAMAGVAAQVAIVPLCILLVITLIGIPLAPVAVVTFLCILVVGFTVVAVWIGERLPLFKDKKTMFASLVLGFVVLTLIDLLIPIVGTIMVFTASLIGAGAVLLSRFGQVRAATLPPPPSQPSPGTYMTRT